MITKENFKDLLEYLNFEQEESNVLENGIFKNGDFAVDFEKEILIYPKEIKINDNTTTNFKANENFVVFEAVFRLVQKGYKPEHIELEPKWQVGHGASGGKADILIRDNETNSLIIIECKTFGREFKSAWKEIQNQPTQLFSYFQQERNTKFIALYTSDFVDKRIINNYYLINLQDNDELLKNNSQLIGFKDASTVKEIYQVWSETYDKEYSTLGLFENNQAYEIGKQEFSLDDLKIVSSRDIQGKYHEFATILRKYNVSGREQAFDKLVNLFLCKVTDERENSEKLSFYWKGKAYDDPFEFQDRLQKLYKNGMKNFLNEDITYIDNNRIDEVFGLFDLENVKNEMKQLLKQQKFFTHNDFAFIEVHNEKLFYQNFRVLLEVARILQDISLTGSEDNQFLGDMFEGFLDQGVKQTEGQFFTPMPIVKFIINSLPSFEKPKVIDYACGSGHFLNEYASLNSKAEIIGIEQEYRLSKVAKVSSFMYGNNIDIVFENGLRNHKNIKNETFDVLIANPPYSVKGFLDNLTETERKEFELYSSDLNIASNNSIETFFIERTKQLLKTGGVAGIIVPTPILNKGNGNNLYVKTREIILKYFDIVAIAEFGSGTFGKTGTNTTTLFLRRKSINENLAGNYFELSQKLFDCKLDFETYFKENKFLEKYCSHIGVDLEIYKKFLCNDLDSELFKNEVFQEYKKSFEKLTETKNRRKKRDYISLSGEEKKRTENRKLIKFIKNIEQDKFYFFILATQNKNDVLIIKSPTNNSEIKKFLGYEWSGRKGDEGIKYYTSSNSDSYEVETVEDDEEKRVLENFNNLREIDTVLYNPQNLKDETRINSFILDHFNKTKREIPKNLKNHISYLNLIDMLDFRQTDFNKAINTSADKKIEIKTKWDLFKLGDICNILIGGTPSRKNQSFFNGSNLWVSISEMNGKTITDTKEKITEEAIKKSNVKLIPKDTTLLSFKLSIGKTAIAGKDLYTNEAIAGLIPKNNKILNKYIFVIFNAEFIPLEKVGSNTFGKSLNSKFLKNVKIPLPPLEIQNKIVAEIEEINKNGIDFSTADILKYQDEVKSRKNKVLEKYL